MSDFSFTSVFACDARCGEGVGKHKEADIDVRGCMSSVASRMCVVCVCKIYMYIYGCIQSLRDRFIVVDLRGRGVGWWL